MVNRIILILIAVFTVVLSGLFAGAETGIYQLSQLRLRLGIEQRRLSFVVLGKAMRDSPRFLLSMLVGNNLTHYIVTSIVTYILWKDLLSESGVAHTAELFATFITAPILFVFAELIPKSVFFYRADYLMSCLAPVLFLFHKIFSWCGAVPLLKFMSGVFAGLTGSPIPPKAVITAMQRHHIRAISADSREEGVLSSVQADIINRIVSTPGIHIMSVMVPINKVQVVDVNSDNSALLNKLKKFAFTRLPVVEGGPTNIVGFINIYEALSSPDGFTDLRKFIQPIRKLRSNTTVIEAIDVMQSEHQKIVLVTKMSRTGRERPIGIVTMKDLVEELLGELAEW